MKMRFVVFAFCVVGFIACNHQKSFHFESENQMLTAVNDPKKGFLNTYKNGDLIFDTQFLPALENDSIVTIKLRISHKDGTSVLQYNTLSEEEIQLRENKLSFDLSQDVYLEVGDLTLYPLIYHYERNYRLKPSIDVFFEFRKVKTAEDVYFNFRDKIFQSGLIRIKIENKNFNSTYHD